MASFLQGMVNPVPAGFIHQVIMVAGTGINDTMHAWGTPSSYCTRCVSSAMYDNDVCLAGDLLLQQSGKQRTKADADLVVSTLSYWTDNVGRNR
jgi:hypothetical protein